MSSSVPERNLLTLWLGVFINSKRKEALHSLKDVGDFMGGLKASYVRTLENGFANLSPARVLTLRKALNIISDDQYSLSRVSSYLVSMQIVSQNGKDLDEMWKILKELSSLRHELHAGDLIPYILTESVWSNYKVGNYDSIKEIFSSPLYMDKFNRYLSGEDDASSISDESHLQRGSWESVFNNAPSTLNEYLISSLNNIEQNIKFIDNRSVNYSILEWEKDNRDAILNVWAVVQHIENITNVSSSEENNENTDNFDWSHILKLAHKAEEINVEKEIVTIYVLGSDDDKKSNLTGLINYIDKNSVSDVYENKADLIKKYVRVSFLGENHNLDLTEPDVGIIPRRKKQEWWIYKIKKEANIFYSGFTYDQLVMSHNSDRKLYSADYEYMSNSYLRKVLNQLLSKNKNS